MGAFCHSFCTLHCGSTPPLCILHHCVYYNFYFYFYFSFLYCFVSFFILHLIGIYWFLWQFIYMQVNGYMKTICHIFVAAFAHVVCFLAIHLPTCTSCVQFLVPGRCRMLLLGSDVRHSLCLRIPPHWHMDVSRHACALLVHLDSCCYCGSFPHWRPSQLVTTHAHHVRHIDLLRMRHTRITHMRSILSRCALLLSRS